MARFIDTACCIILFLAALVAAPLAAQSVPPSAQPVAFTLDSAPEVLVYRFFFAELAASQDKADELAALGKDARPLRDRYKNLIASSDTDFQNVTGLARQSVAALKTNNLRAAQLLGNAKTGPEKQKVLPEVAQLRKSNESAVLSGVEQLRAQLSAQKFAELDRRIREHIVPNLKLYPVGQAISLGGK
jgi:hypothetical protein